MRSLFARLAVLSAFAVSMAACSNGTGTSLPFAGPPNNAGGSPGTIQSGGNGVALIRFVQGSPDSGSGASKTVDICIDNLPFNLLAPSVNYGAASQSLYSIPGGITHTISVYPGLGTPTFSNGGAGAECPTAPGPYFFNAAIAVTTLNPAIGPAANARQTVVLAGTAASGTLGLYVFGEPNYPIAPGGPAVVSHNAAPAFSKGKSGVGFGICTTTVTPCAAAVALGGAQNRPAPTVSGVGAASINPTVTSAINSIPAGFYDGSGVAAGTPVPITSIAAPSALAGQPYVIDLYAIDGPAGGLNLVPVIEQTLGFGF
jgi:hypothetical protein